MEDELIRGGGRGGDRQRAREELGQCPRVPEQQTVVNITVTSWSRILYNCISNSFQTEINSCKNIYYPSMISTLNMIFLKISIKHQS